MYSEVPKTKKNGHEAAGEEEECGCAAHVAKSLEMIRNAVQRYAPEKVSVSFNGGKDSVVMMELLKMAVGLDTIRKWNVFVLDEDDEFPELIAFRSHYLESRFPGVRSYHFPENGDMRCAMWAVKEKLKCDAVFMGTRRSDPNGRYQATCMEPTTEGWPSFLRICPVFDWPYHCIWNFLKRRDIPSCVLYSEGYTSLGKKSLTTKNERLRRDDGTYSPAWALCVDEAERSGRT